MTCPHCERLVVRVAELESLVAPLRRSVFAVPDQPGSGLEILAYQVGVLAGRIISLEERLGALESFTVKSLL